MTWDPDTYPSSIRAEVHDYDELQRRVAEATGVVVANAILDLGVGAGETARRALQMHPDARLVGIDSSAEMLRGAAAVLPHERVTLLQQDLSETLPQETFDLVISALAIHHLEGARKAKLFGEVAGRLRPGGLFVMGDVVIPEHPSDVLIENEPGYDFPSTVGDQLEWIEQAGLSPEVVWTSRDLAVIRARHELRT